MPTESVDFRADVLAIAAHRDDVEQTCGGTLLRMAARGLRTAILDLTQGEAGTRGSAEDRAREAGEAARILGAGWRQALTLPDGGLENTSSGFFASFVLAPSFCPIGRRGTRTTPSRPHWATMRAFSPA
jgi:LmbE family N-acetylglucosaminyl deacetylase